MSFIESFSGLGRGYFSPAFIEAEMLNPNDKAWNLLYGAIIENLGVSPQNFQLIYPTTSWNWATNNRGFTNAAQYDFCATIPQWSAVGSYVSSGSLFDNAYQQFLNYVVQYSSDPSIQQQIVAAQNNLTQASQNLQTIVAQALSTYNSTIINNNPTYTEWLGTPAGAGYAAQINALNLQVNQAQQVVNQLANEQTTPNIAEALKAFSDESYYTKLSDPTLTNFPSVPAWSLSESSQQWVNQVQGGGGTGGSISFSNSSQIYNYSSTWASGSLSIGDSFWSVYANGSWQKIQEFYSDSSLTVTISFQAWDTISITPSKWYSGVAAFRNGPFKPNYTPFKKEGSLAWMFGDGGVVPLFKTGMLVCYQPSFSITVSQDTYNKFSQNWSAAAGITIGPFQIGGSAGGTTLNWDHTGSNMTLKVQSSSNIPLIFGCNVMVLP